jgi:hypothetical protein
MSTTEQTTQPVRIKVVISDVVKMLEEGIDRKAISKHYGLTGAESKQLFQHPKLLNKKVRVPSRLELEDDTPILASPSTGGVKKSKDTVSATEVATATPVTTPAPAATTQPAASTATTEPAGDAGQW